MQTYLSEIDLVKNVPSVFANRGAEHMSTRYGFIPTIDIIRGMEKVGFRPVSALQSRSHNSESLPFVKHTIRFRHEDAISRDGVLPEIVLINSHNGSTSYQLKAGLFRKVCSNGLIISSDIYSRRIKHHHNAIEKVVEAAEDIVRLIPESVDVARQWNGIALTPDQRREYAERAAKLKWDDHEEIVRQDFVNKILLPRRIEDMNSNLWTTFNTVQENLIRGGLPYFNSHRQHRRTRQIVSVSENVRINTGLWSLTENMATLLK